jgi:hypothetical protein
MRSYSEDIHAADGDPRTAEPAFNRCGPREGTATVTVTPSAPPNTFGYAVQGAVVGTTMPNSVSAMRYRMAGQNGTVTSMSVFIASSPRPLITNSRLQSMPTTAARQARSWRPVCHKPSCLMPGIPSRSALRLQQTPTTGSLTTRTVLPQTRTTSDMILEEPLPRGSRRRLSALGLRPSDR